LLKVCSTRFSIPEATENKKVIRAQPKATPDTARAATAFLRKALRMEKNNRDTRQQLLTL
jgi:hypothetical protein